jgi:hypothetical protein
MALNAASEKPKVSELQLKVVSVAMECASKLPAEVSFCYSVYCRVYAGYVLQR